VYTGNVHDRAGDTTSCPSCGREVIVRDWYEILDAKLRSDGACAACGATIAGRFDGAAQPVGRRRRVRLMMS
jgi:pyruvate formate lyase activating enzyme